VLLRVMQAAHAKTAKQRADMHHKTANKWEREYGRIFDEDLNK
jgi:hypothetical protein